MSSLVAPASCLHCHGKRFEDYGNGYFKCLGCGEECRGRRLAHIEKRLAQCKRCAERFVYTVDLCSLYERKPWPWCGACRLHMSADKHRQMAAVADSKGHKQRVVQRRAVRKIVAEQQHQPKNQDPVS